MDRTASPRSLIAASIALLALIAGAWAGAAQKTDDEAKQSASRSAAFSEYVRSDGSIKLPTDYRDNFTYLGSYAVATKPNQPIDEMHNVYSRPEDVAAFRKNGKFPDGAVVVKDVTSIKSENLTTGNATWSTDVKLWFVMIKDAKGRFPDSDLWGDGWGWGLYYANDPAKNVVTDYTTDCRSCHIPARKDDWIYVRGYPALRVDEKER